MYEFIYGEIAELTPAQVIVQAGGVGYAINISLNTYMALQGVPVAKVFTHLAVRDDAHILYGFATTAERELFRNLISVGGVGAITALTMLSSLTPDEISTAISTENVNLLRSVKGIGVKTAQRIIIELKDKMVKVAAAGQILVPSDNTTQNEALSALVMLGFARKDAEKAVAGILKDQPGLSVEIVIKHALNRL